MQPIIRAIMMTRTMSCYEFAFMKTGGDYRRGASPRGKVSLAFIQGRKTALLLILLDVIMAGMDGTEVLSRKVTTRV